MKEIIEAIKKSLTPDLLKKRYREENSINPMFGHCYVASEALYHILNKPSRYQPVHGRDEVGIVHWWIVDKETNEIIDVTADQYFSVGKIPPYSVGRRGSFLTNLPSKRCIVVMDRVKSIIGDDFNSNAG
jgi:hypothetical protein